MKAFLVVCLLSAVSLANARSLNTRAGAAARLRGRVFAGAEGVGPSGGPGVTYSLGAQAAGHIGGAARTGLDGNSFGPWSTFGGNFGQGGSSFYPGGYSGYWPGYWPGYGGNGYGWGSPYDFNGAYVSPWSSAYGSNYNPYGHNYGFSGYPQGFRRNFGGNSGFGVGTGRRGAVSSGPAGLAASGPARVAASASGPASASPAASSSS
uniref:Putative salivary gland-associated protein n=1 Tax=Amblyomma parvum TaxID=251391 RepID=A0A023G1H1_AMBPA